MHRWCAARILGAGPVANLESNCLPGLYKFAFSYRAVTYRHITAYQMQRSAII